MAPYRKGTSAPFARGQSKQSLPQYTFRGIALQSTVPCGMAASSMVDQESGFSCLRAPRPVLRRARERRRDHQPVYRQPEGGDGFPLRRAAADDLNGGFCRTHVFSWLVGLQLGWGVIGIAIGMSIDLVFRGAIFIWRYRSQKWTKFRLV